jgi:Txe/YoeB family toxin of toxin-antitoxin system
VVSRYRLVITKAAQKDKELLKTQPALQRRAAALLDILAENPYQSPPSYEKLSGAFASLYSRRINRRHRLVYEVMETEKLIKIVSMWSHYDSVRS